MSNPINLLKIVGIVTITLLVGCSRYVVNKNGYVRPPENQQFNFKNRFEPLADLNIIDTTTVYYMKEGYLEKESQEYTTSSRVLRFYGDGHFKMQSTGSLLNVNQINNPNYGAVGYYYLNRNVVKMQYYNSMNGGSVRLQYGYINEEGDLTVMRSHTIIRYGNYTETKIKKIVENSYLNPMIYKKTPIDGLEYQKPNW